MSLLVVILVLVIFGLILHLVNAYAPMDPKVKQILNVVVILALIVWLVGGVFGWYDITLVPEHRRVIVR